MADSPSSGTHELPLNTAQHIDQVCDQFESAWRAGQQPSLERFLADTPEPALTVLLQELLAVELAYRRGHAEPPNLDEYQRRFPDHAGVIKAAFLEPTHAFPAPPAAGPDVSAPAEGPGPARTRAFEPGGGTCPVPGDGTQGPDLSVGAVLGGYELLEKRGSGGMGLVFRARQRQVDRIVALKVIRPRMVEELGPRKFGEWLERFRREAQLTARLEHEAIVTVYEVGESAGQPYYSMRYIDGPSLSEVVREGPIPGRRAAAYLERAARAVHYAHTRGVLHRDLKPANILIDQGDRAFVTDFGLARWVEGTQDLTATGTCLGSPPYMSPEQVKDSPRVTAASDVYSLGATLYDLVTGRPPFRAAQPAETMRQVLDQEPAPPRQVNAAVDRDLETITLKCLSKEPSHRYPTAAALADDLGRYLRGEPIQARPAGPVERLRRWGRRNPLVAGLLGAVVLLVLITLAATVAGYWHVRQASRETQRLYGESREALRTSLLDQTTLRRLSTAPGRRWAALDALQRAATIRPGPDLRDEYLYWLDQADVRPLRDVSLAEGPAPGPLPPIADAGLARLALLGRAVRGADPRHLRTLTAKGPVEFEVYTGRIRARFEPPEGLDHPALLSPDGRLLVARSAGRVETAVWDVNTGRRLGVLRDPDGQAFVPQRLAFHERAEWLAAAYRPDRVGPGVGRFVVVTYRLTPRGPEVADRWELGTLPPDCLRFNDAGTVLAAGAPPMPEERDYSVRLREIAQHREMKPAPLDPWHGWDGPSRAPDRIRFGADGRSLLAVRGTLRCWDLGGGAPRERWSRPLAPHAADSLASSRDGRWVITFDRQTGQVGLWDTRPPGPAVVHGTPEAPPANHGEPSDIPADSLLVSELTDGATRKLRLWELVRPLGRVIDRPNAPTGPLSALEAFVLAFSPDERWLVFAHSAQDTAAPYRVDLQTPDAPPTALKAGETSPLSLAYSAAGDRLWGASHWRQTVWDGQAAKPPEPTAGLVVAAAYAGKDRVAAYVREKVRLRVLDLETGRELFCGPPVEGNLDDVSAPVFSPDGSRLLAGRRIRGSARVVSQAWDVARASPHGPERVGGTGHLFFQASRPATLHDAKTLAVQDLAMDKVRVVDPRQPPPAFLEHYQEFGRFCTSPAGRLAAEAGANGEIAIWPLDGPDRTLQAVLKRRRPPSFGRQDRMAFSRDGTRLAAFDGADHLAVWDTRTGKEPLARLKLASRPELFAFSGEGELLLVNLGRGVQVWRPGPDAPRPLCTLDTDDRLEKDRQQGGWWQGNRLRIAQAVGISADGERLVYVAPPDADGGNTIFSWSLPQGRLTMHRVTLPGWAGFALGLSADGRTLALHGAWAELEIANLDTGAAYLNQVRPEWTAEPRQRQEALNRLHHLVRFDADGSYAAIAEDQPARVRLTPLAARSERLTIGLPLRCSGLALAGAGRFLAVGQGRQVAVFDHAGRRVATLDGHAAEVASLAFDREGTLLASAAANQNGVTLWNPQTGQRLASLPTGNGAVRGVGLSPPGRWLAALDFTGRMHLWDLVEVRQRLREVSLDW
jgi:WD40 repeat protein